MNFKTPILLIIFNRPQKSSQVFEVIKKMRPEKLFIAADGARPYVYGEKEKCDTSRSITELIDWPCELHTNFLEKNIGCDERVPSAISWFFENVDEGIIFEDDCLPGEGFFLFCQELLEKYKNTEKIMMISGNNFQKGIQRGDASYYFSHYSNTWGFATWKRAWANYDHSLGKCQSFMEKGEIYNILSSRKQVRYWLKFFRKIRSGKYTFWDAKWNFSVLCNNGICIIPNKNLVTNIGHDHDGTHTHKKSDIVEIPIQELEWPLKHPSPLTPNIEADCYLFASIYDVSIIKKIENLIANAITHLKRKATNQAQK